MANYFDQFDGSAAPAPAPAASSGNYFDRFDGSNNAGIPASVAALQGDQPAATLKPPGSYSLWDPVKQLGASALEGAGDLVSGVGGLGQMLARPIVAGVNAVAGKPVLERPVNAFKPVGDWIGGFGTKLENTESDAAKAANAQSLVQGSLTSPSSWRLGEGASNPKAWLQGAAGLVGQAIPMLAGGIETKGLQLAPELAAKVASGAALDAGEAAAVKAATAAASRRTLATGAGIGGLQGAQGSADAEQQRIMAMTPDQLAQLPGYTQRLAQGMAPKDAQSDLAQSTAANTFAATLPVATAAGMASALPFVHGAQEALTNAAGRSVLKRMGAGAAIEAPLQGTIGMAQQAAQTGAANATTGEQNPLLGNSLAAFGGGAAAGGLFGVAGAMLHRPFPNAEPGSLSDAANAIHEQAASSAAATAATTPTTDTGAASVQPTTAPRVDPGLPPWADPDTGEIASPKKPELVSAMADHMLGQYQASGDMRVDVNQIAQAWHVDPAQVRNARTAATKLAQDRLAQSEREAMVQPQATPADAAAAGQGAAPRSFDDIAADIDQTHDAAAQRLDAAAGADAPSVAPDTAPEARKPGAPLHAWTPIDDSVSVPYAGGVSDDGRTVYLDKRMPASVDVGGTPVDARQAVALHERTEWPLMHLTGPMDNAALDDLAQRVGLKSADELPQGVRDDLAAGKSLDYAQAHDLATQAENQFVRTTYGVDPGKYQAALTDAIDAARKQAPGSPDVPHDLDAKPYANEGEAPLAKGIEPNPDEEATHGTETQAATAGVPAPASPDKRGAAGAQPTAEQPRADAASAEPARAREAEPAGAAEQPPAPQSEPVGAASGADLSGGLRKPSRPLPAEPKLPAAAYDMTPEQVRAHAEAVNGHGKKLEDAILGDQADAWRRALRQSESNNDDTSKRGEEALARIEEGLSPAEHDALYGVGGNAEAFDDLADYQRAHSDAMVASPGEAGEAMARFLSKLGGTEGRDPAAWPREAQVAYAGMRTLGERIAQEGWDSKAIQKRALQLAASRYHDASDAELMLRRFLPQEPQPKALPQKPAKPKAIAHEPAKAAVAAKDVRPSAAARDAEGLRVKTPDGEMNGRVHVDRLIRDGYTRVESTRAGDRMVHSLVNDAGDHQPIKARQLAYAKEAAAKHAENDGAATKSAAAADEARAEAPPAKTESKPEGKGADKTSSPEAPAKEANTKDAGQELWANRRNSTGKGLGWSDVEGLNDTLKAREAVKAKVWPRPDYEKLVEEGLPAPVAHLIKQVYDAVGTKPHTVSAPTDAQYKAYIEGVHKLRDAVFEWARALTEGDAGEAANRLRMLESNWLTDEGRRYRSMMADALFPLPPGADAGRSRFMGNSEQAKANNALAHLLGGNKLLRAMQPQRQELANVQKALKAGWPKAQEAWQRKGLKVVPLENGHVIEGTATNRTGEQRPVYVGAFDGHIRLPVRDSREAAQADLDKAGRYGLLDKRNQLLSTHASEAEAAEAARATQGAAGGDGAKTELPVKLSEGARQGVPRRAAHEDVTSDRLLDTFGFKGVNFGNWMKGDGAKAAAERQAHLNHAYDAFQDLAEIMHLPPRALGLDGTLGLAVGAQGKGGKRAAMAHFVPGVNEINLTRESGAGSLAHEWAHAFDHYFATQAGGKIATDGKPFLTEHLGRPVAGVRPEVKQAFDTIVETMRERPETDAERDARLAAYQRDMRSTLDRELSRLRQTVEAGDRGGDKNAALAQFDELAKKLRTGDLGEGYVSVGKGKLDAVAQHVGQLLNLAKEATGRRADDWQRLNMAARLVSRLADTREAAAEQRQSVSSEYLKEAQLLEGTRKTPYWSTNLELFARAFQSYVLDKLAAEGGFNHYLTRPQLPGETVQKLKGTPLGEAGDRYPRGAERTAIDKAFDTLVGALKTETRENGSVRLFRQGAARDTAAERTAAQQAHTARIKAQADGLTKHWQGDDLPKVKVVDSPEQFPESAKVDPQTGAPDASYQRARGMYDGKDIWIAANKHADTPEGRAQLARSIAHEGVGHFGVDRIVTRELGADAWKKIEASTERLRADPAKASPRMAAVVKDVEARYRRENGAAADPTTFAKELLAVTAERGIRNGLLDRAVAAVRTFVRKLLPDLKLNEADLRHLLTKSDEYLQRGETPRERVQSRAALAFSKEAEPAGRAATATPEFKRFFGDWQAAAAQRRFDALKPVTVHIPEAWRGLSLQDLRAKVREALEAMVASGEPLRHGEIGEVAMTRNASVNKPLSSSRDPAKLYVLGDLRRAFEGSIYASESAPAGNEPNVAGYEKLLGKVDVDGHPLAAVFTVRRMRDGRQFYNTVTLGQKETPAVSPRDTPASGERATSANTGVGDFVRQQLRRVNPDEVSKVVDKAGQPLPVYHGTADDFSVFGHDKAGEATGHATSPLGHFFTPDRAQAEGYARNASDGRPADERVVDAYLSIKKPYTMSLEQAQRIETPGMARAVRAQLEAKGYDGIHLPEQNAWVAFRPEQIKSASENRGTFDRNNPNIYFDKSANVDDSGKPDKPGERRPFSHAAESIEAMHEHLPKLDDGAWQKAKDWLHGKWLDAEPKLLGALQLRHVLELAKDIPELKEGASAYADKFQAMDADRNQMQVKGAGQVKDLTDWAHEKGMVGWRGKLKPEAKALFKFQHEVTQLGVDPTNAYEKLLMRDGHGDMVPWTKELIKERVEVIREQMRGRAGDDKTKMIDQIKELQQLPAREKAREAKYPELLAKWNALTPKAKEMFVMQRDHYREQAEQLEKARNDQIEALDLPRQEKLALQKLNADMFEQMRSEGVYFPLQRFGDFWIAAQSPDVLDAHGNVARTGDYNFTKYETAKQAIAAEKRMRAAGYEIYSRGRQVKDFDSQKPVTGSFMAEVQDLLRKSGAPDKVRDAVNQMYLKTLPELSLRKRGIHRYNVAGYTDNVPRVFASSVLHGSHQIAKARYGWQLSNTLDHLKETLEAKRVRMDVAAAAHADALLGELDKRHSWVLNPTSNKLVTMMNAIGFTYYLSASPASAAVNLAQTPMITLPVLAAQHGWDKAGKVLASTVKDAIRTGGDLRRTLKTDEERQAFDTLQAAGTFTRTATHTLGGVADDNALQMHLAWSKVLNAMGYLFQKAEVVNRTSAGMAAFRLARAEGKSVQEAIKHADEIVNGTHFDYSNANRSRWMQGSVGKVLGQFKSYSVGMTWLYYRSLYKAMKGETPEVRALARRTLTGVLGMTGLFAGFMGTPISNLVSAAANAYNAAFGDDNKPWDFATEFHSWLAEHLGTTAADAIAYGPVSQVTGADVSHRLSASDMWFRDTDQNLTGEKAYDAFLESMAGPIGGIAKNLFVGAQQFNTGHTERGIETMMPTALKNVMKGMRYATQGVDTLNGAPIVDDVSGPESLIQAMGFQPTKVAEQQRVNSALRNAQAFVTTRRTGLMNAYAMATVHGDGEAQSEALAKIRDFNQAWPQYPISMNSLRDSLRTSARNIAEAQGGVRLNRRLDATLRDQVAPASAAGAE